MMAITTRSSIRVNALARRAVIRMIVHSTIVLTPCPLPSTSRAQRRPGAPTTLGLSRTTLTSPERTSSFTGSPSISSSESRYRLATTQRPSFVLSTGNSAIFPVSGLRSGIRTARLSVENSNNSPVVTSASISRRVLSGRAGPLRPRQTENPSTAAAATNRAICHALTFCPIGSIPIPTCAPNRGLRLAARTRAAPRGGSIPTPPNRARRPQAACAVFMGGASGAG